MRRTATRLLSPLVCLLAPALAAAGEVRPSEVIRRTDDQPTRRLGYGGGLPVRTLPNGEADRSLAPYFHVAGQDAATEQLPLEETTAQVTVVGVISHVRLRQVFRNDGRTPIEAVYLFPASTRAAVHDMRMKIGARTIEARLLKREEARAEYDAAKGQGKRAALLEQQRPNVFTTSVANVMPGDRIEVELEYSELIVPEDGTYEVVVPGVVGPRYPGGADPGKDRWIANPHLSEGQKEPWKFDVRVRLEAALPLKDVSSPSHAVEVDWRGGQVADVRLARSGGGNKDFILRYRLAGEQIQAGALTWRSEKEGFFTLIMEPPTAPKPAQIAPREYIFVVDVSGSMHGFPLEVSKALMRDLLGRLRPTDHFNVLVFAGNSATFSASSVPSTAANIQRGISFVGQQHASGGTELLAALKTAYALPRMGDHVARSVVLATDGYVAVEAQTFRFVREHLDQANLFAFGIGTGVNRALIEGLARAGHGEPWVVTNAKAAPAMAEKLRRAIEEPVLTDISVRYLDGFQAREVAPMKLPDLMARRPLVLFGKFAGAPTGAILVSGYVGGQRWSQRIEVTGEQTGESRRALQWLWARKWVELLEDQHHLTGASEVKEAVTDLGLAYRLVTPFTSFVAVDSEVANQTGAVTQVQQPLPLPEGVSNHALGHGLMGAIAGGRMTGGESGSVFGGAHNNAMGGLMGGAGLGARGSGPGGGGTGPGLGGMEIQGGGRGADGLVVVGKEVPRVVPGKVRVSGALDRDVVARVVRRHQNEVRYCYEQQLDEVPTLAGKLVVRFIIKPDGTVESVTVTENTLENEALEKCVTSRVKRWKFPAPGGVESVSVTYPWIFSPPGAE